MNPKLDFVGVGPQKTGSTWLYELLKQSRECCMPLKVKETFFWDRRSSKGLDWYWRNFPATPEALLRGEVGPTYFEAEGAPQRLFEQFPDCRIIISLRDPAARAFSVYLHHWRKGRLGNSFEEAVREHDWILEGSRYGRYIPVWLNSFGRDQVLVICQEDLRADPGSVAASVATFLGLKGALASIPGKTNVATVPRFQRLAAGFSSVASALREREFHWLVNAGKALGLKRVFQGGGELPTLDPATRQRLVEEYAPDIAFVEELLGREFPGWHRV